MRMWSLFRGWSGSPTTAIPAVCTPNAGPRCTIAVALGGPPGIATSSRSARSSAASAALADAADATRGRTDDAITTTAMVRHARRMGTKRSDRVTIRDPRAAEALCPRPHLVAGVAQEPAADVLVPADACYVPPPLLMAHLSKVIRVLAAALSIATALPTIASARSGCRGVRARQTADFASRGPWSVGVRTLRFIDQTCATPLNGSFAGTPFRPLDTEVWYPAAAPPTGTALRDAPLDTSGAPYPLVLYGHALQDSRTGEAYLAEHLASRGYIVAAVDFPLGKLGAPCGATPDDLANQPGDLRAVLEHLLAGDGGLAGAVDVALVIASGLSLGAATVMLLTYHRELRDRRIRAVLPIAPAFSCAFTRAFYKGMQPALAGPARRYRRSRADRGERAPRRPACARSTHARRAARRLAPRLHGIRQCTRHARGHRSSRVRLVARGDRIQPVLPAAPGWTRCGGRERRVLTALPGGAAAGDARLRAPARADTHRRGGVLRRLSRRRPERALLARPGAGRGEPGRRHAAALTARPGARLVSRAL